MSAVYVDLLRDVATAAQRLQPEVMAKRAAEIGATNADRWEALADASRKVRTLPSWSRQTWDDFFEQFLGLADVRFPSSAGVQVDKFREESREFLEDPSADEAVDCIATLICYAHRAGVSPSRLLGKALERLEVWEGRSYTRRPDGTWHHIPSGGGGVTVKTRSWTFEDKSDWGPGPWHEEPDKIQWPDPATGLPCLVVRNRLGALCGYVGVGPTHPWYGVDCSQGCYNENCSGANPETQIDVHGSLTFSGHCQGDPEGWTVCHLTEPGEPDDVWWFGFDCAHAWDLVPAMIARERQMGLPPIRGENTIYRTLEYVRGEVASLARQLARVAEGAQA